MAWTALAKPGTEFGPCEGACKHSDCALSRKQATTICPGCKEAIGYERCFVHYGDGLWHQACAEDAPL
jgi:hypothetical protein